MDSARATASSKEGEFAPALAVDGNPGTRWGSGYNDKEHLAVDLGKQFEVAGVRIRWEAAYGKDYDVLVSPDNVAWTTAATVRDGDGGEDVVLFRPRAARHVKIQGVKRGTGWGYSIFEIEALGKNDLPQLSAEGTSKGTDAAAALDGDQTSAWEGTGPLCLDFRRAEAFGGLRIRWGKPFAANYAVSVSEDGKKWRRVAAIENAEGGDDLVWFPREFVRFLRIEPDVSRGAVRIAEVGPLSANEMNSLAKQCEAMASQSPPGAFPRWLRREQAFWTITGVSGDVEETLLSEDAAVEPFKGSFSVMPFLVLDGRPPPSGAGHRASLASGGPLTWTDFTVSQSLDENSLPIPTVRWEGHGIRLLTTAISHGKAGASATLVRYRVENAGPEARRVRLGLAVRPLQLNPPWQHGGVSPIRKAAWDDGTLSVNGRPAVRLLTKPTAVAAAPGTSGDAYGWFARNRIPAGTSASDANGLITALAAYDLEVPSGGAADVVVSYPLHPETPAPPRAKPAEFFDKTRAAEARDWKAHLGDWRIRAPIPRLEEIVRSNLAYMLLNRDRFAPEPGPRNYAHAFMRDGAISAATYLRYGLDREAREYVEWFAPLVGKDGFVPFIVDPVEGKPPAYVADWKEYDSQGEFVFTVHLLWRHDKDLNFLKRVYPAVQRALDYTVALLEKRRTDQYVGTEFYGILPESNSHEGYFPAMHSYWDDFWALRGFADGARLADALGRRDDAKKFRAEEARLRRDVHASIRKVIESKKLTYIPGCAEKGDPDATSTSIAFMACAEGEPILADSFLEAKARSGYEEYVRGIESRWKGGAWTGFTPYEARNVEALIRLGRRDDAAALLGFLCGKPVRPTAWNHLTEVVFPDERTAAYIGDMPHTWVGADLANAARALFVYEDEAREALVLCAGVPRDWIGETPIGVEKMGTLYGIVSVDVRKAGGAVEVGVQGSATPPGGFVVRLPFETASEILLDGKKVETSPAEIRLTRLPARVVVRP
jgi:hypothetical protein